MTEWELKKNHPVTFFVTVKITSFFSVLLLIRYFVCFNQIVPYFNEEASIIEELSGILLWKSSECKKGEELH